MTEEGSRPRRPRSVHHLLAWLLSLPERLIRVLVGMIGGLGGVIARFLPRPIRETRFFRTAVERQLRMMTDIVGQSEIYKNAQETLDAKTTFRIGVGGAVDNLMILGLHASPIWLLLAATDICEGAKNFTRELGGELKDAGFMKEGSRLDSVDDVLEGLAGLSGRLADALDKPPLSIEDMKTTVSSIKGELGDITDTAITQTANISDLAKDLSTLARKGRRSILEVTSAVALGTLSTTGNLLAGTVYGAATTVRIVGEKLWSGVVLDYADSVKRIHRLGYYGSLRRVLRPQSRSLKRLFAYSFLSWTELLLSFGLWRKAPWASSA